MDEEKKNFAITSCDNACAIKNAIQEIHKSVTELDQTMWTGTLRGARGNRGINGNEERDLTKELFDDVKEIIEITNEAISVINGETRQKMLTQPPEWSHMSKESWVKHIVALHAENPNNPTVEARYKAMLAAKLITLTD